MLGTRQGAVGVPNKGLFEDEFLKQVRATGKALPPKKEKPVQDHDETAKGKTRVGKEGGDGTCG